MLNIGLLYMGGQASAIGLCDGVLRFDTVMSRCTRYIYSNPLILPTALSPPPDRPPPPCSGHDGFPLPQQVGREIGQVRLLRFGHGCLQLAEALSDVLAHW